MQATETIALRPAAVDGGAMEENGRAQLLAELRLRRARVMGCEIDRVTLDETLAICDSVIASRGFAQHMAINVAKLVSMQDDDPLRESVARCELVTADGQPIVWASRLLGDPLPTRVAGIDLMQALLARATVAGYRIYILGAKADVLEVAVQRMRSEFPDLELAGYRDGYYTDDEEPEIAAAIAAAEPDILFVAMSSPRKEYFLARHGRAIGVPFVMGVGGSIDVLAGVRRRAPVPIQRIGLEWLFRLAQEPRRLMSRYVQTNTRFLALLAGELVRSRITPGSTVGASEPPAGRESSRSTNGGAATSHSNVDGRDHAAHRTRRTHATHELTHLAALESEAVHVMREVAAEFERPVLLFSGGKDSIVLLRLAEKAFRPARFPFPVMHIDTGHNFPEAIEFRDRRIAELGERLIVASVQESIDRGRAVEHPGPDMSRNRLQTVTLLDAIAEHRFDAAFGGARRDEERARAKERVFSFRDDFGQWDPKGQRPELWRLYNGRIRRGEHVRIFPLSNWTELDVWRYIEKEGLEVPSLYFAHQRRVFRRDGMLYAACSFVELRDDEQPFTTSVRYRTVGDMTCTGAVQSTAITLERVIAEIAGTQLTERGETRADDRVTEAAMEDRKREGYF